MQELTGRRGAGGCCLRKAREIRALLHVFLECGFSLESFGEGNQPEGLAQIFVFRATVHRMENELQQEGSDCEQ